MAGHQGEPEPGRGGLGDCYRREGRVDEAVTLIEHALQQGGDSYDLAWGHGMVASIALSRGDTETAAWHAQQARAIRAAHGTE